MAEQRNIKFKTLFRRASSTLVKKLASEAQSQSPEQQIDFQNYSKPLRRAGTTAKSIANDIGRVLGMNKNSEEAMEISKKVFDDVSSKREKFKELQEALRNKELFTNEAVKQYLLKYDKSSDKFKFEQQCKKCDSFSFSLAELFNDH